MSGARESCGKRNSAAVPPKRENGFDFISALDFFFGFFVFLTYSVFSDICFEGKISGNRIYYTRNEKFPAFSGRANSPRENDIRTASSCFF